MKTLYPQSDTKLTILKCFFKLSKRLKNKKLKRTSTRKRRNKKEEKNIIIMIMIKSRINLLSAIFLTF
jgi:hypothetical protein